MSYGFEVFKSNGTRVFSSDDKTFVLIDEFIIGAGSTGTRSYPGYPSGRVFATAIRTEPGNTSGQCPSPGYTFGHAISLGGDANAATVSWSIPQYPAWGGNQFLGYYNAVPSTNSTVYVFSI